MERMNRLAKKPLFCLALLIVFSLSARFSAAELSYLENLNSEELEMAAVIAACSRPANIAFADPKRSIHSQILLVGTDFDHFDLNDNRQQVVEYCADELEHVLLDIAKDTTNYLGRLELPLTEEERQLFRDYLTPSPLEIGVFVKAITAGSSDGWIAAAKLMQLVKDYPGDQTTRPVFFAALARAAGIPTRFAVGFRYFPEPNRWVGWIWNEIWIQEWVAVDPASQQMAPDALLVKLMSTSSLTDLQLRNSNFGIVQLSIRQIDTTAEP